jgi:hypothetical protein
MLLPDLIIFLNFYSLCYNLRYAWRVAILVLRYIVHQHCLLFIFILYAYYSLKNGISSKYQGCIILCMLYFVDECSSTEWCLCWFACRLYHRYSCCLTISADDHLSTNQKYVCFQHVWISLYLTYTPICMFKHAM